MSSSGGYRVVTDNLLCVLDGFNPKTYDGVGNTVYNHVGTDEFTMIGNFKHVVDGHEGYFDSGNADTDAMRTTPTYPSLFGNPSFTVCGLFKAKVLDDSSGCWGIGESTNMGISSYLSSIAGGIGIDLWGQTTFKSPGFYSTTEWKFITWIVKTGVFSRENVRIYINDVEYTGSDLILVRGVETNVPNINSAGITLGRIGYNTALYQYPMFIQHFMIYDRDLTHEEVLANYEALKYRI